MYTIAGSATRLKIIWQVDVLNHLTNWGGVKIVEWNEHNCDLNENRYIREAYDNKLWAFVSDYFRLKALYDYGGIYLDTDVEVKKPFPEHFFEADLVLGYMYECAISTAVIMAKPHHPYIKGLLDLYETMTLRKNQPNNAIFNDFTFANYPNFRLNGKFREFTPNCFIYPRYYFEVPTFGKEGRLLRTSFHGVLARKKDKS